MTLGNLLAKSSNLVILTPIVLMSFSKEEIVVWYLYFTIVSLQLLIDFGFLPTFTRLFSYAFSGLTISEIEYVKERKVDREGINWNSLRIVFLATKSIYIKLSILTFLLAVTIGSWFVYEPFNAILNPQEAWLGWFLIISIASFSLYANSFVALLMGMNKVALVQRWQMISSIMAVITSAIAILILKSLFIGIFIFYMWYVVNFIINYKLSKKYFRGGNEIINRKEVEAFIKTTIWPTAWRSGLGVSFSMGLIQLSSMVIAKIGTASVAASYMLGLQIIRAISSFSQAPFYSLLPKFTQLYARDRISELLTLSKKRMQISFAVFLLMFLIIGLFIDVLLEFIGSNASFPTSKVWIILGAAFLVERYGAMYLQLYTLTNHIIWHIANGVTGTLMIIFAIIFYRGEAIIIYPLAMLLAYSLFYTPYVLKKTYKEYNLKLLKQEKDNFILVFIVFCILAVVIYYFN